MNKLATVKALKDSGPQVQLLRKIQDLQRTIESLEPLLSLDVQKILASYDEVTAAQRKCLDALTEEMIVKASYQFNEKSKALTQSVTSMQEAVKTINRDVKDLVKTTEQLRNLPSHIEITARELTEELNKATWNMTSDLKESVSEVRSIIKEIPQPKPWKTLLLILAAALIAGLLVLGGAEAVKRWIPNKPAFTEEQIELMKKGVAFDRAYQTAGQKTRELLNQKYSELGK